MTNKELSQLYYLKREQKLIEERIKEIQAKVTKVTTSFENDGAGKPSSSCAKFEPLIDKQMELECQLASLQQRINEETYKIQGYILKIDDSLIRLIITLRCLYCYSWEKVARAVGGNNTADSVRKTYMRYISNN